MKKTIIYCVALVAFAACGNQEKQNQEKNSTENLERWGEDVRAVTYFKNESIPEVEQSTDVLCKFVEKDKIFNLIMDAAKQGKLKVYKALFDEDSILKKEEIMSRIERIDTLLRENPSSGKMESVRVREIVDVSQISSVVFKEDWFFDKDKLTLTKKVKRACLVKNVFAENGELKGHTPLFWVEFN